MIGVPVPTMAAAISQARTRDYLSYSAISTYRSCPLKYMFRYVVGLPERTVSSSLVFGSAIHQGIEYFFNELMAGGEPPSIEALLGEYDRHWESVEPSGVKFGKGEDRDSLSRLAQRMFAAFQASDFARPVGRILGVEEELRASIVPGCPDLLGRLDLVVETPDAVIVNDLKTARSRWSSAQVEESSEQLLLYHELVKTFAPAKRIRLRFAVLTKTKVLPSICTKCRWTVNASTARSGSSSGSGARSKPGRSIPHRRRSNARAVRFVSRAEGGDRVSISQIIGTISCPSKVGILPHCCY